MNSKILTYEEASAVFERERIAGRRVVQCHGTFDLIHPGHIVHLEEARALGDLLVVTVFSFLLPQRWRQSGWLNPIFTAKVANTRMLQTMSLATYMMT